ncbi:MAG: CAP domain-containing protein [Chloroflexota bacterium]
MKRIAFTALCLAVLACNTPLISVAGLIEEPTLAPSVTALPPTPTQFVIPPTQLVIPPTRVASTNLPPTATAVTRSLTPIPRTATHTRTSTSIAATATKIPTTATPSGVPPTATRTRTPIPPSATKAPATATTSPSSCATLNVNFENTVIILLNAERAKAGLGQLTAQPQLMSAARAHSVDMACKNFFDHTGSDGSSPFDRMARFGYSFSAAAENVYAGGGPFNSPESAVTGWMNSPGHRANILNGVYVHIGSGYAFNDASEYGGYFANSFGRP